MKNESKFYSKRYLYKGPRERFHKNSFIKLFYKNIFLIKVYIVFSLKKLYKNVFDGSFVFENNFFNSVSYKNLNFCYKRIVSGKEIYLMSFFVCLFTINNSNERIKSFMC